MKKKIGIVNRTNLKNFGSVLQVYALYNTVKTLGYDAEIVWQRGNLSKNYDIRPNKIISIALKLLVNPNLLWSTIKSIKEIKSIAIDVEKAKKFDNFVITNFVQVLYTQREICKIAKSDKYDKFICGSDQIWCTTTLYPDPMMYLQFSPREKRIAYAPSLGRNYIPSYNKKVLKKYINSVPCLSVREEEGRQLIKELTGRDALVVADPTLLMNSTEWDNLKIDIRTPENYVLCYFLDEPSEKVKNAICNYADKYNKDIIILGKLNNLPYPQDKIHLPIAGPGEFLTLVSKASMIITDSYHGMLFAINYHKKFWSVERAYNQYDQSSRQKTILSLLGLENRYMQNNFRFTDLDIDYTNVQLKINNFVDLSINFLKKSLLQ